MKQNRMANRVIAAAVMLLLILNLAAPAGAASGVAFSLQSKKYENGTFVAESVFSAGDNVYISVNADSIPSIGGITLTLSYNRDLLTFNENESFCTIGDEKGEAVFYNNNGEIITGWDTTSSTTEFFSGPMFYFAFSSKQTLSADAQCEFSLKISELFDGSKTQNNIAFTFGGAITAHLKIAAIPDETLKLFKALKTVTYSNNSLEAIIAAEKAFADLTSKQQQTLKNKYDELYGYFSTARLRYNKLAEQAGLEKILQEIKNYEAKHAAVLAFTVESVKLSDKAAVNSAVLDLDLMSSAAKSRFDKTKMSLIKALGRRIGELADEAQTLAEAKSAAAEFKDTYSALFKEDITPYLKNTYELYGPLVSEALLLYSIMSEPAQALCKSEYGILQDLKTKIDRILENDAREAEILEKITAFQQQYIQVFKINSANVAVEDETAIKMVLEAYKKLEDKDVKERLGTKMKSLENFLTIISGMKKSEKDPDNIVIPLPVQSTPENSAPGGNAGDKVVETVVKEVQNTKYMATGFSTTLWILLILLALSVFLGIAAFYVYLKTEKPRVCEDGTDEVWSESSVMKHGKE